ncbi:MAG: Gfo/Idh/MocA family oxidoreductase [Alphaproteobacteria bacterium]|nr:Gfo/Idh/MocA family oxidoreductase [Alphaproteobacteria bacterium]
MADRRAIGIVGLGMASLPHGKSLLDLADRVEVRAAFSPSATRRDAFAQRFAMPIADRLDDLLNDPEISAVLLLTPPNARQELVHALAARGKHILMEKPIERSTAAALDIVDRCDQAGIRLGMVFQHRFRKASMALQARLKAGELGGVRAVQLNVPWWRPQSYYDEPGRGTYARDGGGVLMSQAIHSLDLMLSLAGPVTEVAAMAATTGLHRMESEDFVGAGLRFESGAVGSFAATTACYPGGIESLIIVGDKGTAILAGSDLTLDFQDGQKEHVSETAGSGGGADPMAFPHHGHRRLIESFLDALDQNREPSPSGREALLVHRLIDALLLSAKERRHVRLEETS